MIIELQRTFLPEDIGMEELCGICEHRFHSESIIAQVSTDERIEEGWACPECVAYFGRRRPDRFPTMEEYEEAKRRYPEPMWSTKEALAHAEENETAFADAYEATWVWTRDKRAPA